MCLAMMGNQKPEDSTTVLSAILNTLLRKHNKHDNDDNNNNTGAMKITPSNTTTAVCLTAIALCLSPLGVAIAFGQEQEQPTTSNTVSYSPGTIIATSDNSAEELNHTSQHADIIDRSTDPFPPQEVQRTQQPPSKYDINSDVTMQEYYSFIAALRDNGLKFEDTDVLYSHVTIGGQQRDLIVVLGLPDATQPVEHLLESIGTAWGYQMPFSEEFNGRLMTEYIGAF